MTHVSTRALLPKQASQCAGNRQMCTPPCQSLQKPGVCPWNVILGQVHAVTHWDTVSAIRKGHREHERCLFAVTALSFGLRAWPDVIAVPLNACTHGLDIFPGIARTPHLLWQSQPPFGVLHTRFLGHHTERGSSPLHIQALLISPST